MLPAQRHRRYRYHRPLSTALAAALAAWAAAPRPATAAPPRPTTRVFVCGDGARFAVRYDPPPGDSTGAGPLTPTLRFPEPAGDRELRLTPDTAASGTRYRGRDARGDVTLWEHQGEATLTMRGAPTRRCRAESARTPWDEARLLGVEYRALGQEPGWVVEVDENRRLYFVGDYGNTRVATPAPPPATETTATAPGANRVTYTGRSAGHTLTVEIVRQECRDEMSGERSPTTAVVRLDGREYRGCGRWLGTVRRS